MAITPLPPAPARTDSQAMFSEKAFTFTQALPTFGTELNDTALDVAANATAGLISELVLGDIAGYVIGVNVAGTGLVGVELVEAVPATETVQGIVELATSAEGATGTDTTRVPPVLIVKEMIDADDKMQQVIHVVDVKADGTNGGNSTAGSYQVRDLNTERTSNIPGGGLAWSLAYDSQTANFTVGQTITGGTSAATATIVADADGGATGTLKVIGITGTFQNNEIITDGLTGSATANIVSGVVSTNQVYLPAGIYNYHGRTPGFWCGRFRSAVYNVTDSAYIAKGSQSDSADADEGQMADVFSYVKPLAAGSLIEIRMRCGLTRSSGFGRAASFSESETYSELIIHKVG